MRGMRQRAPANPRPQMIRRQASTRAQPLHEVLFDLHLQIQRLNGAPRLINL
jgi:hypothetical protein